MGFVYLARNKVNGKLYVGKTTLSLKHRAALHVREAFMDASTLFHRALVKYEVQNFEWAILFESSDNDALLCNEVVLIAMLHTRAPRGYNLTRGGEGIAGLKRSAATRAKIGARNRVALKGRKLSKEHCANMSKARKRLKKSAEHCAKIKISNQKHELLRLAKALANT